jgi:hypothetical protein
MRLLPPERRIVVFSLEEMLEKTLDAGGNAGENGFLQSWDAGTAWRKWTERNSKEF